MPLPSAAIVLKVLGLAMDKASHSWEYGTVSQALLDWHNPDLSVWSNNPNSVFTSGEVPILPKLDVQGTEALKYIRNGQDGNGKPWIRLDGNTLIEDGSAGDPASLGIPALLIGQSEQDYREAATRQKNHLINDVKRWPGPNGEKGAISHRESHPELWADNLYMVPPFLAYYGVAFQDLDLLKQAAEQCKLYGDVLKSPSGPWHHISGPLEPGNPNNGQESYDLQLWASGNGWAVAGMSRVIATMRKSSYDADTKSEQAMLSDLIKGIFDSTIALDNDPAISNGADGLLRNYMNDTTWFGEVAGTSLIAATVFRMAVLEPNTFGQYTGWAETKFDVINAPIIKEDTGLVKPTVDPLGWWKNTKFEDGSPEGQAFVVLMNAAYRDWKGGQQQGGSK